MHPIDFFLTPQYLAHKQYEALRMFFIDKKPAREVAEKFGYTYRGFTTTVSQFRKQLKKPKTEELFFVTRNKGKKRNEKVLAAKQIIISLRKKYYSVEDIKIFLDSKNYPVCEKTIYNILSEEGFSRLPRRLKDIKQQLEAPRIEADKSILLSFDCEEFKSAASGILCMLPYLEKYEIIKIITQSDYPETRSIDKLSSILSFLALKLSNIRRYTADNLWCMDRGMGLFAGLNVLPKAAWFTSYSHRVTTAMNRKFLKALHLQWMENGLLGDTVNMDFTTIPYWGDDEHLENNWSGKRGKALASMLAVLAQDPDSGIIDYGDTNVMHKNESAVVLEYVDFYYSSPSKCNELKYLVFDSKFTNYENLFILDEKDIKFVTIRRRGKNIVEQIQQIEKSSWKKIRVEAAGLKKRTLKIYDAIIRLKGYCNQDDKQAKQIRQVVITGHGKIKPALVLTNDFDIGTEQLVRKYSRRWIVEKGISEQIDFFHLNRLSSSMVIKVDFDLTMSILAHNLYRLFAKDLERYSRQSDQKIYEKFVRNAADIKIEEKAIQVMLKKKRNLPLVLESMNQYSHQEYEWLDNKKLIFKGASYS